jgi:NTE family protein
MPNRLKIGLALGGGAARAFSHIGVIEGLIRYGIHIDVVAGTSMGAMIGAMFATLPDVAAIKARFAAYIESDEFDESGFDFFKALTSHSEGILAEMGRRARRGVFNTLMITRPSLVGEKTAARSFAFLLEDVLVEQTRIPFAAMALDLRSGEPVILDHGRLREVVAASCAMPGVLRPVHLEGRLLVDGGWVETVPVRAARQLGADFVIAVEAGAAITAFEPPQNALDVIARADSMARSTLTREQLRAADIVLSPHNGTAHWADFSTTARAIERGAAEVDRQMPTLQRALRRARLRQWFGLKKSVQ